MVVDDPQFRDLFLLPRFSQAWTLGLCPVLKDLVKREAKCSDCVSPFCSFHHLIPLLLGLLAEAEALRVEGGVETACASSHVKDMSFKLCRLILKVKGKRWPMCSFLLRTETEWM